MASCNAACARPSVGADIDTDMQSLDARTTNNAQEQQDDTSLSNATTNDAPGNCVPCAGAGPRPRLGKKKSSRQYLLQLGDVAPNFQLQASDGSTMQLSDFRGKKVMVCFYRHPFCPICAYTVNNLIGHYKKVCSFRFFVVSALPCFCSSARSIHSALTFMPTYRLPLHTCTQLAWASNLEVLTIFMASWDEIRIGIKNNLLPVEMREKEMLRSTVSAGTMEKSSPDNRNSNQYPFHALSDPDGAVSSVFRVGRRNLFGCIKDALPFRHVVPIIKTAVVKGDKSATILPSEFLIDEKGIIVDLYRAKTLSETIPMERVNCFLLGDKCLSSSRDLKKQKSKGSNNGSNDLTTEQEDGARSL